MEKHQSIIKYLEIPESFGVVLLTFGLILFLAPYFAGADFGAFKIPPFNELGRKWLKVIGPIVFLFFIFIFIPFIGKEVVASQQALIDHAASAGLTDIENREDSPGTSAPPERLFELPEKEIVITGLSCYRTFDVHMDNLKQLIKKNVHIYVIIVDPDSEDLANIATRQAGANVRNDILQTISKIKVNGLAESPFFHIRFFRRMPSFTGILTDGDILAADNRLADDSNGNIRVQPVTEFTPHTKGLVFSFKKTVGRKLGGFDLFAGDLRSQWRHAEWSEEKILTLLK